MNTINVTPEQIRVATKANLDAMIEIATAQFAAVEKIANLQAVAIKSAFEDTLANVRSLASAKDPQEFVKLQGSFAQPAYENAELAKLAERRVAEWNEGVVTFLDKSLKNIPGASDAVVGAMKQAIAAGNTAYENLTKATKQATEMAEANVAAATESVKGFVAKTRKAA
jgi:phasin family protein